MTEFSRPNHNENHEHFAAPIPLRPMPLSPERLAPEEDQTIDVGRWLHGIRKRIPLVLAIAVLFGCFGLYSAAKIQPMYAAVCSLIVKTTTPQVLLGVEDVDPVGARNYHFNATSFYETELSILLSRAVAERAAESLGMVPLPESGLQPADLILGRYDAELKDDSSIMLVSVVDENPQTAADISNAVAEAYVRFKVEERASGTKDARVWLGDQNQELRKKLEGAEEDLRQFREVNGFLKISYSRQRKEVERRIDFFGEQLAHVQAERMTATHDATVVAQVRKNPNQYESLSELRNTPLISGLSIRVMDARAKLATLAKRYQPAHPQYRVAQEELNGLEADLSHTVDAVLSGIEADQARLQKSEAGFVAAISKERTKEAKLNALELEHTRLTREVQTYTELAELVTGRIKETDITAMMHGNNIHLLDAAKASTEPLPSGRRRTAVTFLLLGLFLGLAAALGFEFIDNTVRYQDDIEQYLKADFLGVFPRFDRESNRKEQELVLPSDSAAHPDALPAPLDSQIDHDDAFMLLDPQGEVAECVRALRTNLLFKSPDHPMRSLLITSSRGQEGKSTVLTNLAVAMAVAGHQVLIVDADMRRPRQHKIFGKENTDGLSSVLVGGDLDEAMSDTSVQNLKLLTAGPIPPNPAELLHSENFRKLHRDLLKRFDFVLFDSPPVGAVTDPVVLAGRLDGAIVVIKSESTPRKLAQQTLRTLSGTSVNLLGVVLNHVNLKGADYKYMYTYPQYKYDTKS